MEILEGDALNRAVAEAEGWRYQEIGDGLGWWVPPPNTSDILPRYVDSADLTWAVVDGLRAKGWRYELIDGAETEMLLTLSTHDNYLWVDAEHAHRNPAILNACLRAMEVDNGE
ncbi:MAG TPA: hypothetical protein VM537_20060 [Anaerolineae bacterium]|nr:hypothetical protein [Anaerolineae bacterium]